MKRLSATGSVLELAQLKGKEFYWTVTRLLGLGRLHDGSQPPWPQVQDKLIAPKAHADALREQIEALRVQMDVLKVQQDAMRIENQEYFRATPQPAIQLGSNILFRTPWGLVIAPAEDVAMVGVLWWSGGRWEDSVLDVMQALLRKGDFYIDVGAHIGLTVVPAARFVGPSGRVIAVEPCARANGLLHDCIAINGISKQVEIHVCAAGEAPGVAKLNIGQILGHSSLLDLSESEQYEEVQIRPLDDIVPAGQPIRLAKIDAEGYEPQIWRGMQRIVNENQDLAVIVEFGPAHLKRAGIEVNDWFANFTASGFTPYEIVNEHGRIRALRPVTELIKVESLNLLLLRQPLAAFPQLVVE